MAAKLKRIGLDKKRRAEMFAERIKELGGKPTSDKAGPVGKGQAVEVIFPFDMDLQDDTLVTYNPFLPVCRENVDSHVFPPCVVHPGRQL